MPETPELSTFSERIGQTFRVTTSAGETSMTLESATASAQTRPDGRPFSVVFREPGDTVLPQATYSLGHEELGELDIFLVPVGFAPDGGVLYEAVFN